MTSLRTLLAMTSPRRAVLAVAVTCVLVLVIGSVALLALRQPDHHHGVPRSPANENRPASTQPSGQPSSDSDPSALDRDLASLRDMPAISPAISAQYPAVADAARGQADLYARAFVTTLFTQDYRSERAGLLAWVQSEAVATREPLVVGLVPVALQSKLGAWSLTESSDGSPTPIPDDQEWRAWGLRHGVASIEILRVTEPASWAAAVADGRITDPGVTARDVDGLVTTTWLDRGRVQTAKRSIFLSLTLEGPPSLTHFGYVNIVAYRTTPVGG